MHAEEADLMKQQVAAGRAREGARHRVVGRPRADVVRRMRRRSTPVDVVVVGPDKRLRSSSEIAAGGTTSTRSARPSIRRDHVQLVGRLDDGDASAFRGGQRGIAA